MGDSIVVRVNKDFYESYVLKQKEQEKKRGNNQCSDQVATSILKKRLDRAGGLSEEY